MDNVIDRKTKSPKFKTSKGRNAYDDFGKVPPQAIELEEAVLGALMLEKNALSAVIDIINAEHFYKDSHQKIFDAIQLLFSKSEPVDILTVTNQLKENALLDVVGGPYYISQLTSRVASSANIEYHARIIAENYMKRELISISSKVIKDAFEDTTDVFELLDKTEGELFSLSERNLRREFLSMPSLIDEAIEEIVKAKDSEDVLRGVPSGFTNLDRITFGWQKSDLTVIAARPGMGKTAFVLSMARNIAVDHQKAVGFFSLEMSGIQLVTRLISSETGLAANKLKRGNLEKHEWEQLNTKINALITAPLHIDDTPALSVFELRAKCRRLKEQKNIEIIIVDYIQLMTVGGNDKSTNREQEISTISRSLKALAKELNIPVIVLSQLNRSVEKRPNKKPILSDLRESGAIEQDADIVAFIYREDYYIDKGDFKQEKAAVPGLTEFIIAKHRNGALETVRLRFKASHTRFENYDDNLEYLGSNEEENPFDENTNTITKGSKMNDE